ncbi:MAG: Rab family GTPase [Promethearchaeota archaeon]
MESYINFLRRGKKHVLKIITVGDPAVGKTSLLRRYTTGQFSEDYSPTLGVNFLVEEIIIKEKESNKKITVHLQLWDIAGHSRFASFKQWYFQGTHGVFLIFDLTRLYTLKNLEAWKKDILDFVSPERLQNNFILLANKTDLNRKVSTSQLKSAERHLNVNKTYETSAKTGENVEESFKHLAQLVLTRNLPNIEEIRFKRNNKKKTS